MICLGLLLGLTGSDIYTGTPRFTFGQPQLLDGIDFRRGGRGPLRRRRNPAQPRGAFPRRAADNQQGQEPLWPTRAGLKRMMAPAVRGTAIGSVLGILPGGGALLSSFIAYNVEKNTSRNVAELGKGAGRSRRRSRRTMPVRKPPSS